MIQIHIATLGCPKNMTDSRHLLGGGVSKGLRHVDDPADADVILVNTCGFIQDATEESISEILKYTKLRAEGWGGRLVVFGCLANRYKNELIKEIPEIDALFGVGEDEKIIEYCLKSERSKEREIGSKQKLRPENGETAPVTASAVTSLLPGVGTSYAYLKIADGCDKRCTFCIIPSLRGRFRSVAHGSIISEAETFVRSGVKELILVAQDICNYNEQNGDYVLVHLLRDLTAIEGDFRIRLLYLYPTEITDELLDFIADEEKICKYLDIPLQHSEDRLLRLMGRRGGRKEYTKLIRKIRRRIPGVTLRTTFIAGFPSEVEEEFMGLLDFIEETRFDRLGVFAYSKEEGAPAAGLKGQIPDKIKKRRLDAIMKRQAMISLARNEEMVGRRCRALVDEIDGPVMICRLESQAPEIDGVVIIEESEDRSHKSEVKPGDFVDVEIVGAYDYDLKGRLIKT
jgi:ribosomal protein S12 methylthiotransferase